MSTRLEELECYSRQLHEENLNITRAARSNSIHIVENKKPNENDEVMELEREVRQLRSMSCMVPSSEFEEYFLLNDVFGYRMPHSDHDFLSSRDDMREERKEEEFTGNGWKVNGLGEGEEKTVTPPENALGPVTLRPGILLLQRLPS